MAGCLAVVPLQWGHDLAVVESTVRRSWAPRTTHASMGPRPRGRGIVEDHATGRPPCRLQWGHDLAVVESNSAGDAADDAEDCFNGATTSRSWNRTMASGKADCVPMLQWGHDLAVVESWGRAVDSRTGSRFNGATTSRSWNPANARRHERRPDWLQWGHDLAVVESRHPHTGRRSDRAASMGPRPRGRGILCAWHRQWHRWPLQWGHDLAVVESRSSSRSIARRACRFNGATTSRSWNPAPTAAARRRLLLLQWGHDLAVVESKDGLSVRLDPGQASMGPRPRGRGIPPLRAPCPTAGGASMGPRPRGRGIHVEHASRFPGRLQASMGPRPRGRGISPGRPARRAAAELQWGHDLAVVESAVGPAHLTPEPSLQWGHDLAVVESFLRGSPLSPHEGFNGATTSRSWNLSLPRRM